MIKEKPMEQERARECEKTNEKERANELEKPTNRERAICIEKPRGNERAIGCEKPKERERATSHEKTIGGERARMRKRTCSRRCHEARGTKCRCVCQGFYHSTAGAANREALAQGTEEEAKELLEQHGFKEGETRYIEQRELPLEVATTLQPKSVEYVGQLEGPTMQAKLDKEKIQELLRKADSKWFATHGGQYKYEEHLEFTADYIVKHYKVGDRK